MLIFRVVGKVRPETRDRDPGPDETRDPRPGTQYPDIETRDPGPGTRDPYTLLYFTDPKTIGFLIFVALKPIARASEKCRFISLCIDWIIPSMSKFLCVVELSGFIFCDFKNIFVSTCHFVKKMTIQWLLIFVALKPIARASEECRFISLCIDCIILNINFFL